MSDRNNNERTKDMKTQWTVRNAGNVLLGFAATQEEANAIASRIELDNPGVEVMVRREEHKEPLTDSDIGK